MQFLLSDQSVYAVRANPFTYLNQCYPAYLDQCYPLPRMHQLMSGWVWAGKYVGLANGPPQQWTSSWPMKKATKGAAQSAYGASRHWFQR